MKRKHSLLFSVIVLCLPGGLYAQPWSGIIDQSRAIDWSNVGIAGGIPNRTTICSTLNPGATSAQINSAISACPAGQVVFLNAGTYTLSAGINFNNKSNVTLRGAGPTKTILKFTGNGCGSWGGAICVTTNGYWVGSPQVQPGGSSAANWTGGFAKGTTQITVGSTSGLSVGQVIILDQANDTKDPGGFIICDANVVNGGTCQPSGEQPFSAPGRLINGVNHNQQQLVKITGISGNTLTISPGLYAPQWSGAKAPGVWWSPMITGVGIENMTLDDSLNTNTSLADPSSSAIILFDNAYECWAKNVRSMNALRNHVWLYQAARVAIVDSYFYGSQGGASLSYGVEQFISSDCLIQNNIFQHVTSPLMTGNSQGNVMAYNYATDNYHNQANWLSGSSAGHDAGTYLDLFEGNQEPSYGTDLYHGTVENQTFFRNLISGWQSGKTANTEVVSMWAYSRLFNFVGNVLGTAGYHTGYEYSTVGTATDVNKAIYVLGYSGCCGNSSSGIPYDPTVHTTLLRWGNYDTVHAAVQWNSSEIPSGNAVPANHNLPASFYLSSKPSWWGSMPWPAVGPDVTGGNISDVGGFAYAIPARVCYNNTSKDSNGILAFDASTCYGSVPSAPPLAPPTGLTAVVK